MIYRFLLITLIVFCSLKVFAQNSNTRLNVIFILADDLGAGDLHITGHPYAKTPNLDKLANQGIRFDRAYMAGGWCAPSRFGLMSGQYPARSFYNDKNLKPSEPTITRVLKDAGYRTAHFGKWHLTEKSKDADTPSDFGIDEYFISNGPEKSKTWTKEQKQDEYLRAKSTDYYVDMAIDFIKKNNSQKSPQPFYMNLWIYPTHSYIHPTPEQVAVYKDLKVNYGDFSLYQQEFLKFVSNHGDIDKAMQAYCADITAMDKALGRLFDFLKQHQLDKNTIVVFTSDNGPGPLTNQVINESVAQRYLEKPDLLNSVGSANIYKERKLSLHEGGIRVPFIVYWPGNTPMGVVDKNSIIQGVDWLPTIASLCNVDLPEGTYDGLDVGEAFLGKGVNRQTPLFWSEGGAAVVLKENWKGYLGQDDKFELYEILKDPSESTNLKNVQPEIAAQMLSELKNWLKEMNY